MKGGREQEHFVDVRRRFHPDFEIGKGNFFVIESQGKRAKVEFRQNGIDVTYYNDGGVWAGSVSCGAEERVVAITLQDVFKFVRQNKTIDFDRDILGL